MNMKKIVLLLIIIVLILIIYFTVLFFPVLIRMDDSLDLGNGYRFEQDYPQSVFIKYDTKDIKGMTSDIIPPVVLKYNYNKKFIIAITKDFHTKDTLYWIVNKKEKKTECLDSIEFYKILKGRNMNLELYP